MPTQWRAGGVSEVENLPPTGFALVRRHPRRLDLGAATNDLAEVGHELRLPLRAAPQKRGHVLEIRSVRDHAVFDDHGEACSLVLPGKRLEDHRINDDCRGIVERSHEIFPGNSVYSG